MAWVSRTDWVSLVSRMAWVNRVNRGGFPPVPVPYLSHTLSHIREVRPDRGGQAARTGAEGPTRDQPSARDPAPGLSTLHPVQRPLRTR